MAVRDILAIVVVMFAFAVGFIFFNYFGHALNTGMRTIPEINSSSNAMSALASVDAAQNRMDYIYFGVFIGFILALLISGWFVSGEGIFMWVYFFVLIFIIIVAAIVSAIFNAVSNQTILQPTMINFPIMSFIMSNLAILMTVVGLMGLLVMFGKPYLKGL